MSNLFNRWWRPVALLGGFLFYQSFGAAPGGVGYLTLGTMGLLTGLVAADYAHKGYRIRSWLFLISAVAWMVWVAVPLIRMITNDESLIRVLMVAHRICYILSFLPGPLILWAVIDAVRGIPRVSQAAEAA